MGQVGADQFSVAAEKDGEMDRRLQIALECAGQAVWEVRNKDNWVYVSPAWFKIRGLDVTDNEAAQFEQWIARVHPDDRHAAVYGYPEQKAADRNLVHCEYRERHSKGHWVWILSQGRIICRNEKGEATRVIGTDTDITALKESQEHFSRLSDSEKRWRAAVESTRQGIWDLNHVTNEVYHSQSWWEMRGYGPDEHGVYDGKDWFDTIHPDDRDRLKGEFADLAVTNSDHVSHEYRQKNKQGEWIWILSRGKIVERDASGKTLRTIGTDIDITSLKESESELRRLSHRYEMAVSTAKVGVWEYDLANSTPIWDQKTRELFGVLDPNELLPNDIWDQRIHPGDRARALATAAAAVQNRSNYAMDYRIVLPTGTVRHVRCRAVYYEDKANGPRLVGVNWDVTQDFKDAEELRNAKDLAEKRSWEAESARLSLEHNSLHDALTNLPNRRKLDQLLQDINDVQIKGGSQKAAILLVDLDRFKQINDTLGHFAGDAVLRRVANTLLATIGKRGIICRSGGDEFVIVMHEAPATEELAEIAARVLHELNQPVIYDGHECLFGASIGIAIQDGELASGRNLLINADIALYRSKSNGRNRFCFFTDDMQQQLTETKNLADEIQRGLERGEFIAVYQPQFDVRLKEIVGVEALVRWRHPTKGILSPDAFLQVADDINVVSRIDEIVLESALADMEKWRQEGLIIPHVSVNISARRLSDAKLIEGLSRLKIPADTLSFELLESIYLDNHNEAIARNLEEIRKLGIWLEIDDFGTGHASIAGLLNLRPKRLKIDRQLISPAVESVETRRLLASIVDIGQALGIEVLAEGVETREHSRILANLDCHCQQGFALALPMEASKLAKFVAGESWRAAA